VSRDVPFDRSVSLGRVFLCATTVMAVCFVLYTMLLAPLSVWLYDLTTTNVLYEHLYPLSYVLEEIVMPIVNLTAFFAAYAAAAYSLWVGGLRGARRITVSIALLTLGKFVLNYLVSSMMAGAFSSLEIFWTEDLPIILPMLLLELLQHTVVILLAAWLMTRYDRRCAEVMPGEEAPAPVLPFTKMFSLKNPLQCWIFWTSILMLLARWYMTGLHELVSAVFNGFSAGWVWILLYAATDLILIAAGYFAMTLLIMGFYRRDMSPRRTRSEAKES
jgi:hypothetical protein